jgi:hypothetical protein
MRVDDQACMELADITYGVTTCKFTEAICIGRHGETGPGMICIVMSQRYHLQWFKVRVDDVAGNVCLLLPGP